LIDLGHSGSRALSEPRCSILPRSRLLYPSVRCDVIYLIPFTGQLERWVSHPGESSWSGPLSVCCHRQQNWPRLSRGQLHNCCVAARTPNVLTSRWRDLIPWQGTYCSFTTLMLLLWHGMLIPWL